MIFDTRDNVSLWLRIIAVALAVAILICGSLLLAWELYIGQMTGERYQRSIGADIDESVIREGEGDQGEDLQTLEPIPTFSDDPSNDRDAEPIHPQELSGLKANIKSWINTGEPVHDSHVTNILLIGMDNQYETGGQKSAPLTTNGRADAMIVLSINHLTKKITMASLMRDQYAYLIVGNKGSFEKLHHSLIYGGPSLQVQMIERYYKIVIDNYVIVNFESVMQIINALGSVTVDVEPEEAEYLNENCGFSIRAGENTFDGSHALVYMRIRRGNTGGDVGRTGRQRKVIQSIINKVKTYGVGAMISTVNALIPYVRTGLSPTEILGYATTALSDGWLNYGIEQLTLPIEGKSAADFRNPDDNIWYWKVDYPIAAQELQLALYGKTNIELDSNRRSWLRS